jgi:hypothetical protein
VPAAFISLICSFFTEETLAESFYIQVSHPHLPKLNEQPLQKYLFGIKYNMRVLAILKQFR